MFCGKALRAMTGKGFYVPAAVATTAAMFLVLGVLQQFVFLQPLNFFVPRGEALVFGLVVAVSVLTGMSLPLVVYKIFNYRFTLGSTKEFLAIVLGISAGCGCSVGIGLIAISGSLGSSVLGFLSAYQIPLMISSVALLAYSFLSELRFVSRLHCA